MAQLVLLRHGESEWNRQNRFTGWTDVDLNARGVEESLLAGQRMAAAGLSFDVAFTSVLTRAIRTLHLALGEMGLLWIPEHKSWRLNERHYGALQGLNKAETAREFGAEQVHSWRRSYDVLPPALERDDPRFPGNDRRYHVVPAEALPATESLKTTLERVLPYWHAAIVPALEGGQRVIVAAHGNSLRALVKYLDGLSNDEIVALNIPTGVPRVYELDDRLQPNGWYYLDGAR